jgi:hypothetical protein
MMEILYTEDEESSQEKKEEQIEYLWQAAEHSSGPDKEVNADVLAQVCLQVALEHKSDCRIRVVDKHAISDVASKLCRIDTTGCLPLLKGRCSACRAG